MAHNPVDQPEKNPFSLSMEILFAAIVPHIAETLFENHISKMFLIDKVFTEHTMILHQRNNQ